MKQKNIPLFALSALLLFSGCNTETALTTTSGEMTTTLDTPAVTEEVTAAVSADEPDAVIDDEPEPETIDPSTMRDLSMPENLFDLPDPSGYEGLEHYTEQYKFEFTNFDQAIISLVDKSEFEEWVNEHEQEILTKGYSDTEPLTILSFIERFDIPEEKMLEAVKSDTHDIGADCTLDEYDVWRFYNHSTEENLRYYKTGYAIYFNGRVFSPMWLYEHTLTAYYAVGLTADYIRGYRSIYEDIFTLSKDSRNMTDKAWKAFNDKLEAYIISYSENQNRRKYVFDLSAENSEIPEGFIGGWIGYDAFGKTRPDITVSEKEIRIGDHSYEITGSGSDDKISYILYSAGDENMCLVIERKAPYTMYDAQYGEFHDDGTVGTIISDGNNRYIKTCRTNETEDGSKIYKWNKNDVMINMADVRTDIVYDIYNAYSSRFFPIRGKAMYMDNGQKGLKRYESRSKESAMHKNEKTGKTTFMVPVHWAFAEKVALAESRARDAGYTLYIVDSFRPMNSVDPVAKVVKNASLLTYGGTSAHNFGTAVDTGWQRVDKDGNPVGDPYVKNLQVLKKKQAVKGPNGNEREIWWQGVNKLPQEWWHYGDTTLPAKYKDHAKRVGSLYVNLNECMSKKRSKM